MRPIPDAVVGSAHRRASLLHQGVTRRELDGPLWRTTGSGRYAFVGTDAFDTRQRILEAAARLPPLGAVGGWAAAQLHGALELDGVAADGQTPLPVPLCLTEAHHLASDTRLTVSRSRLIDEDVVSIGGVRCTSLVRTAFDLARLTSDLREAVVAVDVMLRFTDLPLEDVLAYADQRRRWRGHRQLRQVMSLADAHALSPPETRLRLLWVLDAGLPPPLVNRLIVNRDGCPVARADLLDVDAGLVGEQDGSHHWMAKQRSEDERRTDRLQQLDLRVLRFTSYDLAALRRPATAHRLTAARAQRLASPRRPATWSLLPRGLDHQRQ